MKQFKKIASLVMALVMVFAMSATVFAKDVSTGQGGDGTITITNATKEVTYTLYKVFDATVSGENIAYSWPADRIWPGENDFFNKDDKGNITVKEGAYKSTEAKDQLSEGAITWIKTNGGNPIATGILEEADNEDLKFTGLKDGYYYVTSSLKENGLITVTSINLHPQIIDKNQGPTWDNGDNNDGKVIIEDDKKVIENDGAFTDVVKFDIGVNATNYVGEDKIVKYYIKDTLGEGLEYVENTLKVTVGKTELKKDSDYTIEWDDVSACGKSHGFEIAINWASAEAVGDVTTYTSLYDANAEIHVTYEATIDNDAVIAGEGNKNTANYRYDVDSDKPDEVPKYPWKDENQKETTTYTYALGLMKTDGKGNALDGAKFKIYYTEGVGENAVNKYLKADLVGGVYNYTGVTQNETEATEFESSNSAHVHAEGCYDNEDKLTCNQVTKGQIVVKGIKAGTDGTTYMVKETKAPDGYNLLTEETPVVAVRDSQTTYTTTHTIYYDKDGNVVEKATEDGKTETVEFPVNVAGITVVNIAGSLLPSTGGIGTTIFYVVGAILVIGAGVLLVAKKRMSNR